MVAGAAAASLFAAGLLVAAAIVLRDPAPSRLEAPSARGVPTRPSRPAPVASAPQRAPEYPPAPARAPDFATAILSALPPAPPPLPPKAAAEAPSKPEQPSPRQAASSDRRAEQKQRVALHAPPLDRLTWPSELPAWRRYAVPVAPSGGRPQVAIVLDDVGLSVPLAERAIALKAPLTLAMLPYGRDLPELARKARAAGHELLVHLPMEPENGVANDPGPNALLMSLGDAELDGRIAWNLQRFEGFVGVNNHMGSRFTTSARRMERLMLQLKARGLLFLDSKTSEESVGFRLARSHGVPAAERDVFLDNERTPAAIRARLAEVERIARRHGRCIAIGHPYPETLETLASWLPQAAANGFTLVPVSALVVQEASG